MEPTGNLKKQAEEATSKAEVKETIAEAEMQLDDDELDQASGGSAGIFKPIDHNSCKVKM